MLDFRFDNAFLRELPGDPEKGPARSSGRGGVVVARGTRSRRGAEAAGVFARDGAASGLSDAEVLSPEFAQVFGGNALLAGMEPYRGQLRRSSVRPLGRTTGRRPRDHAGRSDQRGGRALGAAAQGRGPDAVFAHRRRPRGAALVDPRVPVQRSHAPSRRADHARPEPGRHRRAGGPRHVLRRPSQARARRDRLPRRAVVHPLRQFRTAVFARRSVPAAATGGVLHPPRLPGTFRRAARHCTRSGSAKSARGPR